MKRKLGRIFTIIPKLLKRMGVKPTILYILFSLKLKKLSPGKTFKTKSGIKIPLIDKKIFLYYNEFNEKDIIKYIKELEGYNTFINVGSAYGEYLFFSALNPNIEKVYGFEPVPFFFNIITQVLEMNPHLNSKIEVHNMAITDSTGTAKFHIDQSNLTESSLSPATSYDEIEVNISKIDDLDLDIQEKVIMLIDVEGHEIAVLKGAEKFIHKYNPTIIIEVWNKDAPQCEQSVSEINYKCEHIWKKRKSTAQYWKLNPTKNKFT